MAETIAEVMKLRPPKDSDIPARLPNHVTPYLPKAAERIIANHERDYKLPVFVLAMDIMPGAACRNCGGGGKIYLRRTKAGPFKDPRPGPVLTWFDGNNRFGRGWYQVADTLIFDCPECIGG